MTVTQLLKENGFDTGIAGNSGTLNYSVGYGTPASPNISQNPEAFNNDKMIGSHGNTTKKAANPEDIDVKINQLYNKEITPSPDDVMTGLKYELQNMIKKDKGLAKQIVLDNLLKNPKHYSELHMLGIEDKDLENMPMNENISKKEEQYQETVKLLKQMLEAKGKKAETPQSFKDAIADTKAKKVGRNTR